MRHVRYPISGAPAVLPDNRQAAAWGAQLIARSKARCERDIFAVAPQYRQNNAPRGTALADEPQAAAMWAAVDALRDTQNAYEASVEAILDDTELGNAAKLAALDALA